MQAVVRTVSMNDKKYENAYPGQALCDKEGEFSYLYTDCGNIWYSINADPMFRNGCICPKCGKVIKVVKPKRYNVVIKRSTL